MKPIYILIAVAIFFALIGIYFYANPAKPPVVTTFAECEKTGYPVMESFPRKCQPAEGNAFIDYVSNAQEKNDLIKVSNPKEKDIIKSPMNLEGEARGFWYFEASFPGRIVDAYGETLRSFVVQADAEWMTENFVPFKEEIVFADAPTKEGAIILDKDNPSGLPENADQIFIPIRFR